MSLSPFLAIYLLDYTISILEEAMLMCRWATCHFVIIRSYYIYLYENIVGFFSSVADHWLTGAQRSEEDQKKEMQRLKSDQSPSLLTSKVGSFAL